MTKLCPRGKAAAKRKFKVYPSAYANAYASKICAGKIKDPSGVKRKDFRGPKPAKAMGGRIRKMGGGMMQMPSAMYKKGGKALKPVDKEKNPGLAKLPTKVRNKMGFMKKGGSVKKFPDLSGDGKVTMKDVLMGRGVIKRPKKKGGGLMEATSRLRAQGLKMGGIARGCGAVLSDRRKKQKCINMAGLKTWFDQKWVDIGSKRKDGSFAKCGRSKQKKDAKRKYPKCVPLAKARSMSEGQRRSAVARKRAAANVGPKPTNVKTFAKRKNMGMGGLV